MLSLLEGMGNPATNVGFGRDLQVGTGVPQLWTLVGRIPLEELGVERGTWMESRAGDLSTN